MSVLIDTEKISKLITSSSEMLASKGKSPKMMIFSKTMIFFKNAEMGSLQGTVFSGSNLIVFWGIEFDCALKKNVYEYQLVENMSRMHWTQFDV